MFKEVGIRFVLIEIIFFTTLFFIFGYLFNPSDPLFTSSPTNPYLLFLMTVTLYYGLEVGILAFLLEVGAMGVLYKSWDVEFLLWSLLYVLISAEFHFFWAKKIKIAQEENLYFKDKIRRQASDFILLKLSHDQLEKHYMIKPVSVRSVIGEIKEELKKIRRNNDHRDVVFKKVKDLLVSGFYVQEADLFMSRGDDFEYVLSIGKPKPLDRNDPLVKKALESGETVFISQIENRVNSEYLAVIPIYDFAVEDKLLGIFTLRKIPFNYFNSDTILSLSVILFWLLNELGSINLIEKINPYLRKYFEYDFLKELAIMISLKEKTGIESSLVIYRVNYLVEDFPLFLSEKIRGLDMLNVIDFKETKIIFVMLPLSPLPSARGFVNRIAKEFSFIFGESEPPHRILSIDQKIGEKLEHLLKEFGVTK